MARREGFEPPWVRCSGASPLRFEAGGSTHLGRASGAKKRRPEAEASGRLRVVAGEGFGTFEHWNFKLRFSDVRSVDILSNRERGADTASRRAFRIDRQGRSWQFEIAVLSARKP